MSEYNIQMNKYNALNAEYDQLYPVTKIEDVDGLDTALQNKAPAGYGLGKLIGKYVADLNTHLENGWYYTDVSTINGPVNTGAIVEVSNRDNTIEVQTFWYWIGSGVSIKVERLFNGTEWKPWEWVNPPMLLGDEYRTTERYLGKPVYVRTKEISALAIGSSSSSARTDINNFTEACDKIVRYEMYVTPASGGAKFPIPFIEATTGVLKASGSLNEGQYLYGSIYAFDDLSGYKANVTCWYTKTAD